MYELHVCQNGTWKKLKTFEARQEAMSASIEIERARSFSGVKIFELAFDSSAMGNTKKAIHRWTEEADRPWFVTFLHKAHSAFTLFSTDFFPATMLSPPLLTQNRPPR